MNRWKYFVSPIRVTVLSAIGLIQYLLVRFGCVWVAEHLGETYPCLKHFRDLAWGIGFLSLMYPVYILMVMELPRRKNKETTSNQPSQPIAGKPGSG
jgi:hypothetical protein